MDVYTQPIGMGSKQHMVKKKEMAKRQASLLAFVTKKTDSSAAGEEQASTQMEVETNEPVTTLWSPAVSMTCEASTSSRSESETTGNESADFCAADYCSPTRDKPYQPDTKDILAKTKRIQGQGKNEQARYVQASWFKQDTWLTLWTTRQQLFCFFTVQLLLDLMCLFSARIQTQPLSAVVLLIGEKLPMPFISMKQVRPTQKPC